MKIKKMNLFISSITFCLVFASIMVSVNSEEPSTGWAFVGNDPPRVLDIEYDSPIDVNSSVWINVTVKDVNKLAGMDYIKLFVYNINNSFWDDSDTITNHYTFLYNASKDSWECSLGQKYISNDTSKLVFSNPAETIATYHFNLNLSTVARYVGNYWSITALAVDN